MGIGDDSNRSRETLEKSLSRRHEPLAVMGVKWNRWHDVVRLRNNGLAGTASRYGVRGQPATSQGF
jgi:hypothetical protein